jgi:hypothetical protein
MAFAAAIPLIVSGISALGSYLSGKNKQTQNQNQTYNNTSTPVYDPEQLNARNRMMDFYTNRLDSGNQGFMTGYTGQGMRDINRSSDLKTQTINNILAARGLSSSPVGAGLAMRQEDDRMKQQVDFMSTIPLLARQLQTTDADAFTRFLTSLPTGTQQSGTSTGQGTSYGSTAGAVGSGIDNGLAMFLAAMKYYNPKSLADLNYGGKP